MLADVDSAAIWRALLERLRTQIDGSAMASSVCGAMLHVTEQLSALSVASLALCATQRTESDSWEREVTVLELILQTHAGCEKITVRYGPLAPPARPPLYCVSGTISLHVFRDQIRIVPYHASLPALPLSAMELPAFFRNKQLVAQRVARGPGLSDAQMARAMQSDVMAIGRAFASLPQGGQPNRSAHPFRPALLHILPRLLQPEPGCSPLHLIVRRLERIRACGFDTILLGCVEPQTIDLYYGETDDGQLVPHVNNHGYWSSGASGIDPMIGTPAAYQSLVQAVREAGMHLVQDCVIGTLGYPPQLERFGHARRSLTSLELDRHNVEIGDRATFLHDICIPEEDSLVDNVDTARYIRIIAQAHRGSPFALPKLNLFVPTTLQRAVRRHCDEVAQHQFAGVRIDMAKHLGLPQLLAIITALRGARRESRMPLLLEYWTVRYRDLAFATAALGEHAASCYFYDFPLARAVQNILLRNATFGGEIETLMASRKRWNINPYMLVPMFIDHDFSFRPVYNGSAQSQAIVVVGYALCIMLSANAPYVYLGVDDAAAGPHDLDRYDEQTEAETRVPVQDIFGATTPSSPRGAIADLLTMQKQQAALQAMAPDSLSCCGHSDGLIVRRVLRQGQEKVTIEATFSRFPQAGMVDSSRELLFGWTHGPSVHITRSVAAAREGNA